MPASNTVDSNLSGLSIAEETSLKTVPGAAQWYAQEPNAIGEFGGDRDYVAREPISASRTDQRGTITGVDPSLAFTVDFTRRNVERYMQGFYWADAREATSSKPLNAAQQAITSVASADSSFNAAAGLGAFVASRLILAEGFGVAANNGLFKVATVAAGKITVSTALVNEAAPPAAAFIHEVGHEFAAADVAISVVSGIPTLTSAANALQTGTLAARLIPGAWIYLGGDLAANRFVNNRGYARIATVAAGAVTFDETTWTPVTEAGTGLSIRLFFGTTIRNETNPALIKRRSYHAERTLGTGNNGPQADYVEGAVANDFTLTIPQKGEADRRTEIRRLRSHDARRESGRRSQVFDRDHRRIGGRTGVQHFDPCRPAETRRHRSDDFESGGAVRLRGRSIVHDPKRRCRCRRGRQRRMGRYERGQLQVVGVDYRAVLHGGCGRRRAATTKTFATTSSWRNGTPGSVSTCRCWDLAAVARTSKRIRRSRLPLTVNAAGSKYGFTSQYTLFLYLPTVAMP
jgi:hypothetical protein